MSAPLLLFIDMDGTIIGDIAPQIIEWDIINRFDKKKILTFKENLKAHLAKGIIRPHFLTFLSNLTQVYQNIEVFVYTASDVCWANLIIPCIEQVIEYNFSKPYFTRKHCIYDDGEYLKSIKHISPILHSKLKNKYPSISTNELVSYSLLIDNNNVIVKSEYDKLVRCPTYDAKQIYDVLRNINEMTLQNNYMEVSLMLTLNGYFPKVDTHKHYSFDVFKALYYEVLSKKIKEYLSSSSNKNRVDDFWMTLTNGFFKYQHILKSSDEDRMYNFCSKLNAYIKKNR